jgi:hypothetical protein
MDLLKNGNWQLRKMGGIPDLKGRNKMLSIGRFTPLEIMPRCSAAGLDFRIIPAGFNAPLEFLTGFTLNSNSVNNHNLCFIIYCIKDAIVACPDAVSFFLRELFGSIRPWIGSQGKNSFVNGSSLFCRNFLCFFAGFFFDDDFVAQFFSQVLRKLSYGIKEVASLSALRRSLASSKSSSNSRMFSYSLRLRITAFLFPFLLTINSGLTFSTTLCISFLLSVPILFINNIAQNIFQYQIFKASWMEG